MFRRNLPGWERLLRGILGVIQLAIAAALPLPVWGFWVAIAGGAMLIGTAAISFCPACAVVGRRLPGDR
jgi:hypothetical protein